MIEQRPNWSNGLIVRKGQEKMEADPFGNQQGVRAGRIVADLLRSHSR